MDRKKSAMIRIITWSVVAVVLLVLLVAGIVWDIPVFRFNFNLGNVHVGVGDNFSYSNSGAYSVGSGSVSADGVKDIEVNWLDGRVNFTVYDGDEIVFQETGKRELSEDQQLRYLSKGGRLIIQYCKSGNSGIGIGSWNLNKELEIKIPAKLAQELGELSLDGTSADITAEGFNASEVVVDVISGDAGIKDASIGKFNFSTTSGSAYLERVTMGDLEVSTTSGSVTGSEVTIGGMAEMSTTSGDAVLAGSVSGASLDTVSGELKVDSSVCPGKIALSSTSGDIVLIIPENSGFTVNYDSVSGDVNSDFPVMQKAGRIVSGDGSAKFEIDTVSGDVNIRKR